MNPFPRCGEGPPGKVPRRARPNNLADSGLIVVPGESEPEIDHSTKQREHFAILLYGVPDLAALIVAASHRLTSQDLAPNNRRPHFGDPGSFDLLDTEPPVGYSLLSVLTPFG